MRRLPTGAQGGAGCCHDELEGPVGLAALPPSEAAAYPLHADSTDARHGRPAAKGVTQRSGGATVAQGEPAGASAGVGRRAEGKGTEAEERVASRVPPFVVFLCTAA